MEGITCDFQARQGRRDFSGHSEPRVLRSHSLAGRIFQPNLKLARACKARTPQTHRQQDTTFQQPLPGVYSSQSPRVLGGLGLGLVVKLAFQTLHQRNLENWENFQCAVLGTYQIGRQAITLFAGSIDWGKHNQGGSGVAPPRCPQGSPNLPNPGRAPRLWQHTSRARIQSLGSHRQPSSPSQAWRAAHSREAEVLPAVESEVATNSSKCLPRLYNGYDAFSLTSRW